MKVYFMLRIIQMIIFVSHRQHFLNFINKFSHLVKITKFSFAGAKYLVHSFFNLREYLLEAHLYLLGYNS